MRQFHNRHVFHQKVQSSLNTFQLAFNPAGVEKVTDNFKHVENSAVVIYGKKKQNNNNKKNMLNKKSKKVKP